MRSRPFDQGFLAFTLFVLSAFVWAGCSDRNLDGSGDPAGPTAANEWTMLAHGHRSSYTNPAEKTLSPQNARDLGPLWDFAPRGVVNGTPAVVDGVVYLTSSGGVYALDADSGEVLWQNLEITASASPTLSEGTLFVYDSRASLYALDPTTGTELWRTLTEDHPQANGFSSPVVFERYVIIGVGSSEVVSAAQNATFRGSVAAFDRDSGELLWRDYTAKPPYNGVSVWSTVSIDAETRVVFASSGQNYTEAAGPNSDAIFAIDLETGERLWTTQLTEGDLFTVANLGLPQGPDYDFGANPILFEVEIDGEVRSLVGAGQKSGMFWALDRETGEVVWGVEISTGSALIGGALNNGAYDGERLLVAGSDAGRGDATLYALEPADGTILWQQRLPGWVWAPITVANGVGFVGVDLDLYAFDVETGEILLVFPTEGTVAGGASIANGRVHFGSGLQYFVGTVDRKLHVLALPGDAGGPGPAPGPTPGPSGGDTFTAIYEEIFVGQGCSTNTCHGAGAGNLEMSTKDDTYRALVDVPASGVPCVPTAMIRVVPGDPDASLLWSKVSNPEPICGDTMPIAALIPLEGVEQIRSWIERGAPND